MARKNDLGAKFNRSLEGSVEVVQLEPEQHSVAVGFVVPIADGTVVVVDFEAVQLQDKLPMGGDQSFVFLAAMITATAQQTLVPAAAGFDIGHSDQRLGPHES